MRSPFPALILTILVSPRPRCVEAASTVDVYVETSSAISTVSDKFLSYNIDAAEIWSDFTWNSTTLAARAKHLAPAFIRVGGGSQSRIKYDEFLEKRFPLIVQLASDMNMSLIFGTAPKIDDPLRKLLSHPLAQKVAEWEFGNEPHVSEDSMETVGKDFLSFHALLVQMLGHDVRLVGPDVGFGAVMIKPAVTMVISRSICI